MPLCPTSERFRRFLRAAALLPALGLCLCAAPARAWETTAGDVKLEVSGSLNARGDANRVRERARAIRNNAVRIYEVVVLNGKASTERHALVAQVRPYMRSTFDPASDHYSRVSVDELYWEAKVTEHITGIAGRRQLVNGVALGYNPTDFLSHDKQVTGSNLTDIERRSERKGDNLVGVSRFFETAALQGYLLFPGSVDSSDHLRGLAQFSHRIQPLQTDYTLSAYYDDNLQLGLNIATTLSHSVTGYVEAAFSRDRGRKIVDNARAPGTLPPLKLGSYEAALAGGEYPDMGRAGYTWEKSGNALKLDNYDAVIGMQYTHESGIGLNLEYWRSNIAYSQREFNNIWDNVEAGRLSVQEAESMLSAHNNVQREKVFVRVSDIPLIEDVLELEQTNILGLNDMSFFSRTSLTWQVTDSCTARLNLNHFTGDKRSEFGMVPYEWQLFSSFKYIF